MVDGDIRAGGQRRDIQPFLSSFSATRGATQWAERVSAGDRRPCRGVTFALLAEASAALAEGFSALAEGSGALAEPSAASEERISRPEEAS